MIYESVEFLGGAPTNMRVGSTMSSTFKTSDGFKIEKDGDTILITSPTGKVIESHVSRCFLTRMPGQAREPAKVAKHFT